MAISSLNTDSHQILKDELFSERFFRAVFACHAEMELANKPFVISKSRPPWQLFFGGLQAVLTFLV